jgi:iron-sulfur cluster assembly accessory protein
MTLSFTITPSAAIKIAGLIADEAGASAFRVAVKGGGCSGFQYEFDFAPGAGPDDIVLVRDGATVLVDEVSAPFLEGAEIDWVDDLIGSSFKLSNPNARSSCGCGVSFSV